MAKKGKIANWNIVDGSLRTEDYNAANHTGILIGPTGINIGGMTLTPVQNPNEYNFSISNASFGGGSINGSNINSSGILGSTIGLGSLINSDSTISPNVKIQGTTYDLTEWAEVKVNRLIADSIKATTVNVEQSIVTKYLTDNYLRSVISHLTSAIIGSANIVQVNFIGTGPTAIQVDGTPGVTGTPWVGGPVFKNGICVSVGGPPS